MGVSDIKLFQLLKARLGDQEAESLISFIEDKVKLDLQHSAVDYASKADVTRLDNRIASVKEELLRAIYLVGIVQFLAIIASILAIFNFMLK